MAEIVVNLVIDKLGPLLVQEINLLSGVSKEIRDIKTELQSMRCFLKDAEVKAAAEELAGNNSGRIQQWVSQVREVAYRIEDVIDEFTFTVAQLPHGKGLVGLLQKIFRCTKKLKLQRKIANDIQDIKTSLVKIDERRKRYGINSIEEGSSSESQNVTRNDGYEVHSFFMKENEIVGYELVRKDLNDIMVNNIPHLKVIALVGPGGLGKTTLAANSYKKDDVKCHFNCHAWVYVGRKYSKEDLLRRIIQKVYSSMEESAPENIKTMDEIDLVDMLRKYLENKSYMVVFDDVWEDKFWGDIEHYFPDNNKSNRLIVTTRSRAVALVIPEVHTLVLEGLPSDKAWELFSRKAFSSNGFCPPELEELSHQILKKCGGLPLAIVAVGGLLSKKNKILHEWQILFNNLGSELGSDPHLKNCNRVLSEGYNDLPHHLKPCLLYFGLFPESYSISDGRLIRLWIAEGFVKSDQYNNSRTIEETGGAYLTELVQRSLVQVSEKDVDGKIVKIRVHDLMHEIVLRKTEQLAFSGVINDYTTSQWRKSRRLMISESTDDVLEGNKELKVRSIILFGIHELPKSFMSTLFVANFKLISVLDFENAPIDYIHEGVGNLFHLHYLSLKNTKVKVLPKSIGKLLNLETLDLKQTLVTELPVEIQNLKKLRYLLFYPSNRPLFTYGEGAKIQEGFGSLMDLQKLGYVQVNSTVLLENLRKLRQLRKLGIQLANIHGNDLCSAIENMKHLNSLYIEMINREEILDIQSLVSPPKYLRHLYLLGTLNKFPDWISYLPNLVKLHLDRASLTDDPMIVLHALPNLLELGVWDAYNGERLHIKAGWFPRLKKLSLCQLKGLKFMEIENGAMPHLQTLRYGPCPLLMDIPTGIEHLRKLKLLIFNDMLEEIKSGLITNERWEKLKHISNVVVSKRKGATNYVYSWNVKDILDGQRIKQSSN